MKIIVDNREQRPLDFNCETVKGTLPVGDYGALFFNSSRFSVIFERKSIGDLFGTLSQGYSRFKKEIERARKAGITLVIVIEGTKDEILKGYKHSQRNDCSIVLQLKPFMSDTELNIYTLKIERICLNI